MRVKLDPFADLLVFDAVQGLNSTLQASSLLNLPQSSVSRRYRQFAQGLKLELSRHSGRYRVIRGQCVLQQMRQLAQRFRFLHQLNRWAVHPALADWINQGLRDLPSKPLQLGQEHWDNWLNDGLIDQVLECKLLDSQTAPPKPTGLVLNLVTDPLRAKTEGLILGDWVSVAQLETAVRNQGFQVVLPHQPAKPFQATLQACPASTSFERLLPDTKKVAEVVLHWRYGPSNELLDPYAQEQGQQFERLVALALLHQVPSRPKSNYQMLNQISL